MSETLERVKALVRKSDVVAEVDVELTGSEASWRSHPSLEDARQLHAVRLALKNDGIASALELARVYRLTPITALEGPGRVLAFRALPCSQDAGPAMIASQLKRYIAEVGLVVTGVTSRRRQPA